MRLYLYFFRRHVKARRAINAIAIEQCYGGHLQFSASRNQAFRQGGAFEETESGARVEFDVQEKISDCRFQIAE
jgi:hypothetical protein